MPSSKISAGLVSALGLTQIIGYGTLYYSFSILAPGMAADLGLSLAEVFGVFSVSLFIGGLSATYIGKQMDRIGAATIMTIGSALAAVTLALCAWSPSVAIFAIAIILLEVSSGMVQYQAAFAALVESDPRTASRSITYLTLIGGFASTIFWPISATLTGYLSWREIYLVFTALNLFLCMPLHFWIRSLEKKAGTETIRTRETVIGAIPPHARRRAMVTVSLCLRAPRLHARGHLSTYGTRLRNLDFDGHFSRIQVVNNASVDDFRADVAKGRDELHALRSDLRQADVELADFRKRNGLEMRVARTKSTIATVLKWCVILALLVVETGVNGIYLAKGNDQGLVGGMGYAFAFAFANVVATVTRPAEMPARTSTDCADTCAANVSDAATIAVVERRCEIATVHSPGSKIGNATEIDATLINIQLEYTAL